MSQDDILSQSQISVKQEKRFHHDQAEEISQPPEQQHDDNRDRRRNPKRSVPPPAPASASASNMSQDVNDIVAALPKRKRMNNEYAQSGIIKKIHLTNFLCHTNLEVNFKENLNFIHGENGSGKSAILVGLQTCLGAAARDTNRGTNLKGLIKYNEDSAEVSVTIKNEGDEAFRPKDFGSEITVTRELKASGQSAYKFTNEHGKIVSRKREMLLDILQHFNMQPNNPCIIMTQDACREFLSSKKASDKYHFFLQATTLEKLKNELDDAEEKMKQLQEVFAQGELRVGDKKLVMDDCKKRLDESERLQTLRADMVSNTHRALWATVCREERKLSEVESKLRSSQEKLKAVEEEVARQQAAVAAQEEKSTTYNTLLSKAEIEMGKLSEVIKSIRHKLAIQKSKVREARGVQKMRENELQRIGDRRTQINNKLNALRAQGGKDEEEEEQQRQQRLADLHARKHELEQQVSDMKGRFARLNPQIDGSKKAIAEAEHAVRGFESEEHRLQNELQSLKRSQSDPMRIFVDQGPEIASRIEAMAARFRVKPQGPIGNSIKIHNDAMKWSRAVESSLSEHLLKSYVVDNYDDMKVLREIINHFKFPKGAPAIIVQRFSNTQYQVGGGNNDGMMRVLDVLSITTPWVFNVVVDQSKCEKWLLMDALEDAFDLVSNNRNSSFRGAILTDGPKIQNLNGSVVNRPYNNNRSFFSLDHGAARIPELSSQLAEVQSKIPPSRHTLQDLRNRDKELQMEKRELTTHINKLQDELSGVVEAIGEEERGGNGGGSGGAAEMGEYDRELKQLPSKEKAIHTQLEAVHANIAKEVEAQASLEKDEKQAMHELNAMIKQQEQVQKEFDDFVESLTGQKARQDKKDKDRQRIEAEVADHKVGAEKQRVKVERQIEGAKEVCPERPPGVEKDDPEKLQLAIQAQKQYLAKESLKLGGSEDILSLKHQFIKAEAEFEEERRRVDGVKLEIEDLARSMETRRQAWARFRRELAHQAECNFQVNLGERNQAGTLLFDHNKHTLDLEVSTSQGPASGRESSQGPLSGSTPTSTKGLSGGERSYATLAFVMALGETLQTPFRAMDEFDVYMDSVNRHLSIKLVERVAQAHIGRQFIFLTPQDISGVRTGQHAHIFKLQPPVRGQRTLDSMMRASAG